MIAAILFFNIPEDLGEYISTNYASQWQNYWILSVFLIVVSFVVAPIMGLIIFFLPYKTLRKGFWKLRFGVLFEDLDIKNPATKIYPFLFFMRRITLIAVTILLKYPQSLEMLTLFYMNLMIFVYVGNVGVFKDKKHMKVALFNETVIYHMTI